ncbi:hypothetical protein CesoFtcFv8_003096 [Champsocephalus esox]|uniref:Uncharacterized protein n=1 Tax=Champsocephalus esox TaxID=159716 RepID=A0AAN8CS68_9TELE|nr:hypothetical protein CesoFtcFv8_003096 [Champsocephalus esox]
MQQKPREPHWPLEGKGGEQGVMFTRPPRPLDLMESAESAADPTGVNNCFLSAGISVASSEAKLLGRRPLTQPQPPTCPTADPSDHTVNKTH